MRKMKRTAARLLYCFADSMTGYRGQELNRVCIMAVSTIPACWIFAMIFVKLSA